MQILLFQLECTSIRAHQLSPLTQIELVLHENGFDASLTIYSSVFQKKLRRRHELTMKDNSLLYTFTFFQGKVAPHIS